MDKPTWGDVFKDPALIISLVIMFQFFFLIIMYSQKPSQMAVEAKQVILQAYVSVFTGAVWYWLGSTNGSKMKDKLLAKEKANAESTKSSRTTEPTDASAEATTS
jgi:hypothetical protein